MAPVVGCPQLYLGSETLDCIWIPTVALRSNLPFCDLKRSKTKQNKITDEPRYLFYVAANEIAGPVIGESVTNRHSDCSRGYLLAPLSGVQRREPAQGQELGRKHVVEGCYGCSCGCWCDPRCKEKLRIVMKQASF